MARILPIELCLASSTIRPQICGNFRISMSQKAIFASSQFSSKSWAETFPLKRGSIAGCENESACGQSEHGRISGPRSAPMRRRAISASFLKMSVLASHHRDHSITDHSRNLCVRQRRAADVKSGSDAYTRKRQNGEDGFVMDGVQLVHTMKRQHCEVFAKREDRITHCDTCSA